MKDNRPNHNNTDADLQKHLVEQEAQIRAKSELIDNMIYQIRTLSNAVIGFSDLLLTESLTQDQGDYVKEIHDAGEGLSLLAGNVLDWTQLLSGRLQFSKTKCELSTTLHGLGNFLATAAAEKGLDYDLMIDPELPEYIFTDSDHLLKCLISLAANAVNFMSSGQIQIHVILEKKDAEPYIRFDVIDPGQNLVDDQMAGFFNDKDGLLRLNQQACSAAGHALPVTTSLPLTKMLCDLLGATLDVREELSSGAVFSLRLPASVELEQVPKLEMNKSADESQPQETTLQTAKMPGCVLLVEDQQSNRIVVTLMLEALGVQVDAAENGEAAIEKVDPDKHQLILMDLKMPKMDGYETTQKLRERGYTIPVIALSAKVLDETEHNHIKELFDGFLTKPVNSQQLSEAITKYGQVPIDESEQELVGASADTSTQTQQQNQGSD